MQQIRKNNFKEKCKLFFIYSIFLTPLMIVPLLAQNNSQDNKNTWLSSLPDDIKQSIIWSADHEKGDLSDWEMGGGKNSGGGIFNTGTKNEASAVVVTENAFSGNFSVKTSIRNAYRAKNGSKAVRLMRWTDKPWDKGGKDFPVEAYYSTWMMIPENYNPNKEAPWDPGDGGWWNIFQFKSHDKFGDSQPIWVLNITNKESKMRFYFYSNYNAPSSYPLSEDDILPGKWYHIEVFLKKSSAGEKNGLIELYINGKKRLRIENCLICLTENSVIWGIGNYTDHIDGGKEPGSANIYFDDCAISLKSLATYAAKSN